MSRQQHIAIQQRTAIWLAGQGYTMQQAADAMGISPGAVTSNLKSLGVTWGEVTRIKGMINFSLLRNLSIDLMARYLDQILMRAGLQHE